MKNTPTTLLLGLWLACSALTPALATEESSSPVESCLKAWGEHPFGKKPQYRTLSTSVKVFGMGQDTVDKGETKAPALVLVNPGVNVAGGATIQLLNPNGWYCLRTTVNVMGGLTIKAHCKARIATTGGDVYAPGGDTDKKGVTVFGSTRVERNECS